VPFVPLRTVTDPTSTAGTHACEETCPVPEANRRPCLDQRSIDVTRFGDTTPRSFERQGREVIPNLATVAPRVRDYEEGNEGSS